MGNGTWDEAKFKEMTKQVTKKFVEEIQETLTMNSTLLKQAYFKPFLLKIKEAVCF